MRLLDPYAGDAFHRLNTVNVGLQALEQKDRAILADDLRTLYVVEPRQAKLVDLVSQELKHRRLD
ncbi:hypothetical protein D3C85_1877520 [compost metagenome]